SNPPNLEIPKTRRQAVAAKTAPTKTAGPGLSSRSSRSLSPSTRRRCRRAPKKLPSRLPRQPKAKKPKGKAEMKLKLSSTNGLIVGMVAFAVLAFLFWTMALGPKRDEADQLSAKAKGLETSLA